MPITNGQISDLFEKRVREVQKKDEIVKFLLNHERKNLCFENMRKEIAVAEFKFGVRMNSRRLKTLVDAMTDTFSYVALQHKEMQLKSPAEIARIQQQNNREKDAAAWYEEQLKEATSTATTLSMWVPGGKGNSSGDS